MTSIRSHRNRSSLIAGKALMTSLFWIAVTPVQADEKLDLAASAFDLGLTTSQLIWKTVSDGQSRDTVPATKYDQLAKDLQAKIDAGRASTSLLTSTAGFASASLTYAAVLDPEPTSKLVAGIAAYGAKKGSDLLSQKVIDDTNASVQEVLVLALKESLPNPAKLRAMTADQLREQVADFQIGGQKLRNVLKDSPKALEVMQSSGADLLMNVSVETLSKVAAVSKTAEEISRHIPQI